MVRVLHTGVDRLAMWIEDRVRHEPQPYRPCPPTPLDCDGVLAALPDPPDRPGAWSAPSPRPVGRGDRMVLRAFAARGPAAGTVVVVPPWKTGAPSLVRRYTELLVRAGWHVWLVVPPEHMERAAAGTRSGQGFASLDLVRFRALFEQLVVEIRVAMAMAARRGPAGVVGLSLGALATSFAITAGEPPGFAALVAPPADLSSILCETAIGRRYRRLATRAGSRWPEPEELRRALSAFDPGARARPRTPVFLAVGSHDRIALARNALELAASWGVAPRVYPRGHLTLLFGCRGLLRDLARFVAAPA
jgi:hypothetical protein